jgi:nucleotide-binding universal stress UspA family protein
MFQKILAGVDGSDSALEAVGVAAGLAKAFEGQLVLMHVVQVSAIAEQALKISATAHLSENPKGIMDRLSRDVLDSARERARGAGLTDQQISTVTADGNQARELIKTAEREKVDLVVVGSRGRGRLEGLLLGSVSQKVSALSPCPCMIV